MLVTKQWIEKNYNKFNDELFGGRLPNIKFKVNKTCKSWGLASYLFDYKNDTIIPESITISNYYDSPEYVKIQTLLHEMIHIADYTFNPEHFVQNHKPVSGHKYNAHGFWFMKECRRINAYGIHKVDNHVTKEEEKASTLSEKARKVIAFKKNVALICAIYGSERIWWFKTDIYKVKELQKAINRVNWNPYIGTPKSVKFFTFDNEALANHRSSGKSLIGWKTSYKEFDNTLKKYNATTCNDYKVKLK
jgi:hypothetical protein